MSEKPSSFPSGMNKPLCKWLARTLGPSHYLTPLDKGLYAGTDWRGHPFSVEVDGSKVYLVSCTEWGEAKSHGLPYCLRRTGTGCMIRLFVRSVLGHRLIKFEFPRRGKKFRKEA